MINAPDIFYVEDDKDYAYLVEQALTIVNKNLSILTVENGKKAVDILNKLIEVEKKPHIILLDLNLPGLNGWEILKEIREIQFLKFVPIILFSSSRESKVRKMSLESGAYTYIPKPIGFLDLVKCMRELHEYWFYKP